MTQIGKSIDIFLIDGTASGRWQVTLSNWNCNAYKIPRDSLKKEFDEYPELHTPGVYFLFGRDNESEKAFVYIGEGDDALKRISQPHSFEKDNSYWTEAIVFVTPDGSLDKAKIKYLENRFHSVIMEANRYIVKNGNTPTQSPVQKKIQAMLEGFIINSKLIMPALGHKVFESYPSAVEDDENLLFFCRNQGKGGNAIGRIVDDGFWVLRGSYINPDVAKYIPSGVIKARNDNAKNIGKDGRLLQDVRFASPSYAAAFVCGKNSNGLLEWKDKNKRTLKEINEINDENKQELKRAEKIAESKDKEPLGSLTKSKSPVRESKDVFRLNSKAINAHGYREGSRFIVSIGSEMASHARPSCRESILKHRKELINTGKVVDFVFSEDVSFSSPSTAAAVILGGETNGMLAWKNDDGQSIKDITSK